MGSFFTSSNASQATNNSQLGIQGGGSGSQTLGVGSGNTGTVAAGTGNTATGNITTAKGNINITSADVYADKNLADVATAGINAANQDTITALETTQHISDNTSALASQSLATEGQIASVAAPQSAGYTAESLAGITGQTSVKEIEYIAIATGLVILALYFYHETKH
jgi:hypothetical protein